MKETVKRALSKMTPSQKDVAKFLINGAICMINPSIKGNSITDELLQECEREISGQHDIETTLDILESAGIINLFKIDLSGCHVRYIMKHGVKDILKQLLDESGNEPAKGMKRLFFECDCKAHYTSYIDVPEGTSLKDAVTLAMKNPDGNPIIGNLQYVSGHDEIDVETCEFK